MVKITMLPPDVLRGDNPRTRALRGGLTESKRAGRKNLKKRPVRRNKKRRARRG